MMNRAFGRATVLLAITGIFSFAVTVAQGCGSDTFTASASTDGGDQDSSTASTDAAPVTDAGVTVGADACVKPPTAANPALQPFCNAYAEISTRCIDCAACRQTNENSCETLGGALSAPLRDGIVACKDTIACDALESQVGFVQDPCVVAHILDAGITSAQGNAELTFCAKCGGDAGTPAFDDCVQNYFGQTDGGPNAPGSLVLVSSDDVATAITNGCTACSVSGYQICTGFYFCFAAGKDTCPNSNALCK